MTNGTANHYLRDIGPLMWEMARSAKADADQTEDAYQRGRTGLYEAVSLLVPQADAFGMDRAEIGMSGMDAEPAEQCLQATRIAADQDVCGSHTVGDR